MSDRAETTVRATITRREITEDRRGLRVEWRCGACGSKCTPQSSMFRLWSRECDACGVLNELEPAA